jgi:uncharacterized protein YbaR (Trm112 family)
MSVQLDPTILEVLACPQCHSNVSIDYHTSEVVCTGLTCGLAYPIRDDIPIMLVEEARTTRGGGVPTRVAVPAKPVSPASAITPVDLADDEASIPVPIGAEAVASATSGPIPTATSEPIPTTPSSPVPSPDSGPVPAASAASAASAHSGRIPAVPDADPEESGEVTASATRRLRGGARTRRPAGASPASPASSASPAPAGSPGSPVPPDDTVQPSLV